MDARSIKRVTIHAQKLPVPDELKHIYSIDVNRPEAAARIMRYAVDMTMDVEQFGVICLDSKNRVLAVSTVAIGGRSLCEVDIPAVFRPAVLLNASSIIIGHNHPSGDPTPSDADKRLSSRLRAAGCVVGIMVMDDIVVTNDDFARIDLTGRP